MKQIDKSKSKYYFPLTLYIEDLLSICKILEENCEPPKIIHDDIEYDSIDEFIQNFKSSNIIHDINIKSHNPYINFTIKYSYLLQNHLYISSSDSKSLGVFYKIDEILKEKQNKLKSSHLYFLSAISSLFSFGDFFIKYSFPYARIAIFIVGILQIPILYYIFYKLKNDIYLIYKKEQSSFWKRKKDDIVLAIFSGIIGAGLGAFITKIIDKL